MISYKTLLIFLLISGICFAIGTQYASKADRASVMAHHLAVITELKTRCAEKIEPATSKTAKKTVWCASDVYLHRTSPQLRERVEQQWPDFLNQHQTLVNAIVENERMYTKLMYYIFYHAQRSSFRILQDVLKALAEILHVDRSFATFRPMRSWLGMAASLDANTLIDTLNKQNPQGWTDGQPDIASKMLSVNLSLFGNTGHAAHGECTFDYFARGYSMLGVDLHSIFETIFDYYHLNKKYIQELLDLGKQVETKEGLLMQICIPKSLVNHCAYISLPFGHPITVGLPGCTFDVNRTRNCYISEVLDNYRQGSIFIHKLQHMYDKSGMFYGGNQSGEDIFDALQARLVFSKNILLNPHSGVVILRYSTLDAAIEADYTKKLHALLHKIVSDFILKGGYKKIASEFKLAKFCSLATRI